MGKIEEKQTNGNVQDKQSQTDRKYIGGCECLGEGKRKQLLMVMGFMREVINMLWNEMLSLHSFGNIVKNTESYTSEV